MLNSILNALVSGSSQAGSQSQPSQNGGDLLTGILGSLMNDASTGAAQTSQAAQPEGDMLTGLVGSLLGGQSGAGQSQASGQGDLMSGLLGAMLGGQTGSAGQQQSQPQTDLVSGVLGSLLGGQTASAGNATTQQASGNPLAGLVSSGQNPILNSLIQPVVEQISKKLGISPAIAMTVVTFAVQYMLSNHGTKVARGEDLSSVIQQHTDHKYLRTAGLGKELAAQTGLKPRLAESALSEAFLLLGDSVSSN